MVNNLELPSPESNSVDNFMTASGNIGDGLPQPSDGQQSASDIDYVLPTPMDSLYGDPFASDRTTLGQLPSPMDFTSEAAIGAVDSLPSPMDFTSEAAIEAVDSLPSPMDFTSEAAIEAEDSLPTPHDAA